MSRLARQCLSVLVVFIFAMACGKTGTDGPSYGTDASALKKAKVAITVSPTSATVQPGHVTAFAATVSGSTNTAVSWSATGGAIDAQGNFTAGNQSGAFSVTATSAASSTATANASVNITAATTGAIKYIFVVALENQDANTIYGSSRAPYLNSLMSEYGYATAYGDDFLNPNLPSEPHYVEMEAGTNAFSDHTFTTDDDPSASNSTKSTAHITTQMASVAGLSWMSYQESLPTACPVKSSTPYAAKHNPFIFFQDVWSCKEIRV